MLSSIVFIVYIVLAGTVCYIETRISGPFYDAFLARWCDMQVAMINAS